MINYDANTHVFYSDIIENPNFVCGFGTRLLGDGRQRSTLINFCEHNNLSYESIIVPDQIHSINIEEVSKNRQLVQVVDTTDGVVTKESHVLLTVVTADCLPIMFADQKKNIIGISHQGWRGSLKNMATHMIKKMIQLGATSDSIKIAIGPGIGACCYKIYGERLYEFLAEYEKWKDMILQERSGHTYINLPRLNFLQLREFGIKKEQIDFFPFCTKCDKNRFFSYQRDDKKNYGEMVSFILKT